ATGTITVADVASVVDGRKRQTSYVKIDGKPSMVLAINRQSNANTVSTIKGVQAAMARFNGQFQQQGVDIHLAEAYSQLNYVQNGMKLVQHDLLLGALLAAVVLALFLRAGRPIIITVVSIPISLVSVFLVLAAL